MQTPQDLVRATLENFDIELFNQEACMKWLLYQLHPNGAFCPRCNTPLTTETTQRNFWSMRRVFCVRCRKFFSALSNTFLNQIHLDPRVIFVMLLFMGFLKCDRDTLARMLKIRPETIRLYEKKFKVIWKKNF